MYRAETETVSEGEDNSNNNNDDDGDDNNTTTCALSRRSHPYAVQAHARRSRPKQRRLSLDPNLTCGQAACPANNMIDNTPIDDDVTGTCKPSSTSLRFSMTSVSAARAVYVITREISWVSFSLAAREARVTCRQ